MKRSECCISRNCHQDSVTFLLTHMQSRLESNILLVVYVSFNEGVHIVF